MKIILAHGASGNAASMKPWVTALKKAGIDALAINLPKGNAERAVTVFAEALDRNPGAAIGGHSYGGRVASMLAAREPVAKLVLLSYPLHRPGHPEELRTEHWKKIDCPVLLLSGESDPFAKLNLLQREVRKLPQAELLTWPGQGHGLIPIASEVAPLIAKFLST